MSLLLDLLGLVFLMVILHDWMASISKNLMLSNKKFLKN